MDRLNNGSEDQPEGLDKDGADWFEKRVDTRT
jgi:hypothetical protein